MIDLSLVQLPRVSVSETDPVPKCKMHSNEARPEADEK